MNPDDIVVLAQKDKLTEKEMQAIDEAMMALKADPMLATVARVSVLNTNAATELMYRWSCAPHKVGGRLMATFGREMGMREGPYSACIPPHIPDSMDEMEEIWEHNPPPEEK